MAIQAMNSDLEQIHTQISQISGTQQPSFRTEKDEPVQFTDFLAKSIGNISGLQTSAKQQAEDYMTGASNVGLNDVMVSLQKSSVALNLGVQVRNKLVSAYQDIMNMSV
jgi:flagellar hook-basal body complex protein FliE